MKLPVKEVAAFLAANVLDILVTRWLIYQPRYTEGNPIALYFLHRWGVFGMNCFKLAMTAVVVGIALVIHQQRPTLARRMLLAGTGIVAAVVVYSLTLYWRTSA